MIPITHLTALMTLLAQPCIRSPLRPSGLSALMAASLSSSFFRDLLTIGIFWGRGHGIERLRWRANSVISAKSIRTPRTCNAAKEAAR